MIKSLYHKYSDFFIFYLIFPMAMLRNKKKIQLDVIKKNAERYFHKFGNYTKAQKFFTLFLFVFAFVLVAFPLVTVKGLGSSDGQTLWLLGKTYFKSMIIIFSSMIFLIGWNTNVQFKAFIVKFLGFRENEPILNFAFLWIITSTFMGILDTIGLLPTVTDRISLAWGGKIMLILLLIGLVLSFIDVVKSANKNSQRTKIINLVDEEMIKTPVENQKRIQHLFEDEELE